MTTYRTEWGADTIEISADFTQAANQVIGTNGRQVADFQHRPEQAMRYALEREAQAEGMDLQDAETIEGIQAAVEAMVDAD